MGVRLFVIERSYGVWLVLTTRCRNLVPMDSFWGSGLCPWSPIVALHVNLNSGRRSCADRSRSHFSISCFLLKLTQDGQRYNKPLNLVPRGTQISYSATVDLVAELGVSQVRLLALRLVARLRDFVGHKVLGENSDDLQALRSLVLYAIYIKYYFTLPIGKCKDVGELMMSSARKGEQ
ncbi:hypothetical protein M9H77_23193 [Catharanthus roseus]|uniref:Uncharacterized protein n=1 Tax=Catharanthus roseus TaxID=4058 RepID=A0ACC0AU51_CATRO|nr:hypothetical protein M9H77_23193 [Catharanthus roseus]